MGQREKNRGKKDGVVKACMRNSFKDGPVTCQAKVFDSHICEVIRYRLVQVWQNLKKKKENSFIAMAINFSFIGIYLPS